MFVRPESISSVRGPSHSPGGPAGESLSSGSRQSACLPIGAGIAFVILALVLVGIPVSLLQSGPATALVIYTAVAVGVVAISASWLVAYAVREDQRREAKISRLLRSDPATRLDDRKTLIAVLNAEWKRARKKGRQLSLLIVDVDHFKILTDMLGHEAADEILLRVANRIRASVRPVDTVGRYAGHQFAIVLRNTSTDSVKLMAHMIRQQVEALDVAHSESSYKRLTVSIGCATCVPLQGIDPDVLLAAASDEVREVKRAGRNRVRAVVLSSEKLSSANQTTAPSEVVASHA